MEKIELFKTSLEDLAETVGCDMDFLYDKDFALDQAYIIIDQESIDLLKKMWIIKQQEEILDKIIGRLQKKAQAQRN